jgi:hypothetical protein
MIGLRLLLRMSLLFYLTVKNNRYSYVFLLEDGRLHMNGMAVIASRTLSQGETARGDCYTGTYTMVVPEKEVYAAYNAVQFR